MSDFVPPAPHVEITVATRGYSKGVAQTNGIQVVVRPELRMGAVALSGYAKNVSGPSQDGEAGVGLAYRKTFSDFELLGTAVGKTMLDPANGIDHHAAEFAIALSRTKGSLLPRLSLTWSPNDLGSTGRSAYWEAATGYKLHPRLIANAAIGARLRTGGPDYISVNGGASYRITSVLTGELRWYATSRRELGEVYKSRVVGAVRMKL